jgi:4-amino-4-deoxy-L-arabinose transferase-like glycosyltransferase
MAEDLERPPTPTSVKVIGIVVLGLLAWLLFGSALSIVRAGLALFGYVVVALIAYQLGKASGRRSRRDHT